jgi:hypothetical protein
MDSAKRSGNKPVTQLNRAEEKEIAGTVPVLVEEAWPAPCVGRDTQAPVIALYLTLHCPKCGQLANLDADFQQQPCLLGARDPHNFLLDGRHHEFDQ